MALDKKIYEIDFNPNYLPDWGCPTCLKGILSRTPTSIKLIESVSSKEYQKYDNAHFSDINGTFLGILTCNNKNCLENVVIAGGYFVDMEPNETNEYMQAEDRIVPRYFNPPLYVIPYKNYLPKEVEKALKKSFELFWIDNSACANAIRKVVEIIMDDRGVKKTRTVVKATKTKRESLNLHSRIVEFKKRNSEVAEMLEAIKWIGNEGSHALDVLKREHILDAYEILDLCFEKLYNHAPKTISKTVKSIIKAKGVKKPIKKKIEFGIR